MALVRWNDDLSKMALLVFLYFLQGIPVGLSFGSLPFLLQSKSSYSSLGLFSLSAYPYSLKLLWSPIVDAHYIDFIGRRKSWIIPVQLMSGSLMFFGAHHIQAWTDTGNVPVLTAVFFAIIMLTATQDIAVDGWALTILSPKHLDHASTCQSLGLTAGYFCAFTVFLAFNDIGFSENYLRKYLPVQQKSGNLLSLHQFLRFAGLLYILVSLVLIFCSEAGTTTSRSLTGSESLSDLNRRDKHQIHNSQLILDSERNDIYHLHDSQTNNTTNYVSTFTAYQQLWAIIKLPGLHSLALVLLLAKLGSAAHDSATALKLLEKGVHKQDLAAMAVLQLPFELVTTVLVGRWANAGRPLDFYLNGYACRITLASIAPFMVAFLPNSNNEVSTAYLIIIFAFGTLYQFATSALMMVSQGAFFARISDERIGGTYLTLLNTISNFGGTWPKFIILTLVDKFTGSLCPAFLTHECFHVDGYYACSLFCILIGCINYAWIRQRLNHLSVVDKDCWKIQISIDEKTK